MVVQPKQFPVPRAHQAHPIRSPDREATPIADVPEAGTLPHLDRVVTREAARLELLPDELTKQLHGTRLRHPVMQLGAALRDMASRRARCRSKRRASASRIRTSDLSRACWLCFTSRCAASRTACALRRTSAGAIAQLKMCARAVAVRSLRHRGHRFVRLPSTSAASSDSRKRRSQPRQ